jgi:hypothetical protein
VFTLSLIGGVHLGARALSDKNLIWFGNIVRLSQWAGGGYFGSNDFYLPSLSLERGGDSLPLFFVSKAGQLSACTVCACAGPLN